jgi:hypothetical protein
MLDSCFRRHINKNEQKISNYLSILTKIKKSLIFIGLELAMFAISFIFPSALDCGHSQP